MAKNAKNNVMVITVQIPIPPIGWRHEDKSKYNRRAKHTKRINFME